MKQLFQYINLLILNLGNDKYVVFVERDRK